MKFTDDTSIVSLVHVASVFQKEEFVPWHDHSLVLNVGTTDDVMFDPKAVGDPQASL